MLAPGLPQEGPARYSPWPQDALEPLAPQRGPSQRLKALYEVLLGASDGPRFGGFIALYGVDETVALMERALKGELVG